MRFHARRHARVSTALCLGIALLFTQAASAQQQAQTLEAVLPETALRTLAQIGRTQSPIFRSGSELPSGPTRASILCAKLSIW
jgi:hypothetical protein